MRCAMFAAAILLGLVGETAAHLSAICTTTSKQQPNTFAFWFITYTHQNTGSAPGKVHIRDPTGRDIEGLFGNACYPPSPYVSGSGTTPNHFRNVLATHCMGLSDTKGNVPFFADSSIECYNPDRNSPLPNYALGVSEDAAIEVGYGSSQREYYFVILDNQYVETGSYVTYFTGVDETLDACSALLPCSLFAHAWTFEVSVITGPPTCGALPALLIADTVPASLSACDGTARTIEAGMLCHAQCVPGYAKIGVLECIATGATTAEWNPNFKCSNEAKCGIPSPSNTAAVDSLIKGVLPPCQTLTPLDTMCQYTCTGFDDTISPGMIKCESNPSNPTEGMWVPYTADGRYNGCAWPTPQPTPVPTPQPTPEPTTPYVKHLLGCFKTEPKFFSKMPYHGPLTTPEHCAAVCAHRGYAYAGAELGTQCWCGDDISAARKTVDAECTTPCSGDSSQFCGDTHRMDLYLVSGTPPVTPPQPSLVGCFKHDTESRTLPDILYTSDGNTVEQCTTACQWNGYQYAGLENGDECWCGNSISAATRTISTHCDMACPGDSSQECGNLYKATVYVLDGSTWSVPAHTYEGCYSDSVSNRALPALSFADNGCTVEECVAVCKHNGYTVAGLQYRNQCWCGDVLGHVKLSESQCRMSCKGDSSQTCGYAFKNSVWSIDV